MPKDQKPAKSNIVIGDQSGLPELKPGEFRIRVGDAFRTTEMTETEYATLSNAIVRMREYRTTPQPVSFVPDQK